MDRSSLRVAVLALVVAGVGLVPTPGVAESTPAARPNLAFVLVDDLDLAAMQELPALRPLLHEAGTTFTQAYVSVSLCCPSRATILRGQYSHNTGIFANKGRNGGYRAFVRKGDELSTVGTWLKDAGYTTALYGKYLNGYPGDGEPTRVPPGWSSWMVPASGNPYTQYDYTLNHDGVLIPHGNAPEDYLTDVLAAQANRFVHEAAVAKRPFFLYLSVFAPHSPETPAVRHEGTHAGARVPRTPALAEDDVSDKPAWMRAAEALDNKAVAANDAHYRRRLQSMEAVVDLIAGLIAQLRTDGTLEDTYLVFTSDNGFHFGEHRLPRGKNTAYDEDLRVPLVVRGPGVPAGKIVDALTLNTDFAPTFAALAGVTPPEWVDGRNLAPLWAPTPPPTWRTAVLLEHKGPLPLDDNDTRGVMEPEEDEENTAPKGKHKGDGGGPVFAGVHTRDAVYVEYQQGDRELYDLVKDPYELQNLAATTDAATLAKWHGWLEELRTCRGASCRTAEDLAR